MSMLHTYSLSLVNISKTYTKMIRYANIRVHIRKTTKSRLVMKDISYRGMMIRIYRVAMKSGSLYPTEPCVMGIARQIDSTT